jgi:membrane-bound serine protease (ClpP class)
MIFTVFIAVLTTLGLALLALVAALSLRKRFANRDLPLIGKSARVETPLTPDGTVMVGGELWPARSIDGLVISSPQPVRVVGVDGLSLLVEACDLNRATMDVINRRMP